MRKKVVGKVDIDISEIASAIDLCNELIGALRTVNSLTKELTARVENIKFNPYFGASEECE